MKEIAKRAAYVVAHNRFVRHRLPRITNLAESMGLIDVHRDLFESLATEMTRRCREEEKNLIWLLAGMGPRPSFKEFLEKRDER